MTLQYPPQPDQPPRAWQPAGPSQPHYTPHWQQHPTGSYPQPPHTMQMPPSGPPQGPGPKKPASSKWAWGIVAALGLVVIAAIASGGDKNQRSQTAAVSTPAVTTARAALPTSLAPLPAAPEIVTLPEVKGRNGAIVQDELKKLGLTNVRLASKDLYDSLVILPENWTAVSIEPGAGSKVATDQTVVVTMTKQK